MCDATVKEEPVHDPGPALYREGAPLVTIAWRPNGTGFAIAAGKSLAVHAVDEAVAPTRFPDHTSDILRVVFSVKGDRLASVDTAGVARVFDAKTGALVVELPGALNGQVQALAFSASGKLFAASDDKVASVWSVASAKKVCATADSWTHEIAFTKDEGSLVTTGLGALERWDVATCEKKASSGASTGGTFGSWVAPSGAYAAVAAEAGHHLALFEGRDLAGVDVIARSASCHDHVGPVRFSRDGEVLLASGNWRWFRSYRLDSKKSIAAYDVPRPEEVTSALPFDDGERLFLVRGDKGELVSASSKQVILTLALDGALLFDLSWDNKRLLGVGKDGARVWDTYTGKLERRVAL